MLSHLLSSLLYFVTDCDGTLCHYPHDHAYNVTSDDLLDLPPSAGSGAMAVMSTRTPGLLINIRYCVPAPVVIASGMRRSTCLQRLPYFPGVDWWVLENGGLIIHRQGDELVELQEWRSVLQSHETRVSMAAFADLARSRGFAVDATYETMIRVKGLGAATLLDLLPTNLAHTCNLGHLDIVAKGVSKLSGVRWLLSSLEGREDVEFLFMGDDDNDVHIAAAAQMAYISRPCSRAMQAFRDANPDRTTIADDEGPLGTDALLKKVLERLKAKTGEVQVTVESTSSITRM